MLKVMLIDDEEPALVHLERLLLADGRVEIAGKYTSAQEGLDHLALDRTDVVFLDIGMPEMNGLEAAKRIRELDNSVRIVYITAYSDFAVEAFELEALDYLLKPVAISRVVKTIDRIEHYVGKSKSGNQVEEYRERVHTVRCFGRLELLSVGASDKGKVKFRTKKAQEMFAFLLHSGGSWVTKERLIATLWREYEQDKAVSYLHHSVSRIRWLLKEWDAAVTIEYADDSYRLGSRGIITDTELFEQTVDQEPYQYKEHWSRYEHAASLYIGDYLEDHNYEWAETKRFKLQDQYQRLIIGMAGYELEHGRERSAIHRLLKARDRFPYSDEICRLMLSAYATLGQYEQLESCYKSFAEVLKIELGVQPEQETTMLYHRLRS
jgi:two-component system LytT family response regulator